MNLVLDQLRLDFAVNVRGNCYESYVGLELFQHNLIVGVNLTGTVSIRTSLGALLNDIAEADDLYIVEGAQLLKMGTVSSAATDLNYS